MAACIFSRSFQVFGWITKGLLAASLIGAMSVTTSAQETPTSEETNDVEMDEETGVEDVEIDADTVPEVRPVNRVTDNDFSIDGADQLTEEASQAIATQQYPVAIEKLTEAREIYNDLSTFYQELAAMFVGVDTRQNQNNRAKALETAQKRDEITYQLALLYRSQNQPEEAIPLLIDILRSQQPTRELGQQAYQQLFELGFVDTPYER